MNEERERNYQIYLEVEAARLQKPTYEEVANKYGITKQRVGQIYLKEKERIKKLQCKTN